MLKKQRHADHQGESYEITTVALCIGNRWLAVGVYEPETVTGSHSAPKRQKAVPSPEPWFSSFQGLDCFEVLMKHRNTKLKSFDNRVLMSRIEIRHMIPLGIRMF